ncbi:AAA family ATPase [Candidatus Babeliales bacterium]|nr:AAA family ATPase [Candidatus Babeliales bacterium]
MITLDAAQEEALDMIETATTPVRLIGGPGCGKSTVINHLKSRVVKVAPTNKAAMLIGGTTIHKLLSLRIQRKGSKMITVPTRNTPLVPLNYKVVIDESSCISRDIMNKYIKPLIPKAVYVGDQAQLNPVGETTIPFMGLDIPTKELDYVHRFGGELLEVAYDMRKCVFDPNAGFKVPLSWACDQDELLAKLKDEDVIVAWRNKTVNMYNRLVRMHKFGTTDWQVGEKVRIGSHFLKLELPTESEHFIERIEKGKSGGYHVWFVHLDCNKVVPVIHDGDKEEYDLMLESLASQQKWKHFYALKDSYCDLRPSYAITAHKSQGSTYDNSFVDFADIFENPTSNEAIRAAYVSTTRARHTARNLI